MFSSSKAPQVITPNALAEGGLPNHVYWTHEKKNWDQKKQRSVVAVEKWHSGYVFGTVEFLGCVTVKYCVLNDISNWPQAQTTRLNYHSLWCLSRLESSATCTFGFVLRSCFPETDWGSPTCECSLLSGSQGNSGFNNTFFFMVVPGCYPRSHINMKE